MKQRIVILLFILLSSISTSILAQGFKSELLGNIGTSHCILIDGDTAWLGMQNGILRINLINHNVKWYSTNELNFRSNKFVNIKKDKKGNIWFINNQGQVFEYNHQTFISRDNGTKFLNIQEQRNSFLEVDQCGNVYHFRHKENHEFVPDTLKIAVRDSNSLSIYNSPELFTNSCFTADSLGVFILADTVNGRTIKHFENGVINRSFPVYRASVVPGSGSFFRYDYSNIYLIDTILYYYNYFYFGQSSNTYQSNVMIRYTLGGAFIDSVNFSTPYTAKTPVLNPKTKEIYLFSNSFSQPHLLMDSTGTIQPLPSGLNIPSDPTTAHFDEFGNLYLLYIITGNVIGTFNTFLTKIDTNGVSTFYDIPFPLHHIDYFNPIFPMYDSSIISFDYYANKIILYDGVSVSDFATVTSNFVIDSVNTIYFLRNDSIIKYKNGLTLLKTKLPFTTVIYDPELVYEGGDSLYFYYGSKIYAHHVNTGAISVIGSLGQGHLTMNKKGELFFREQVNNYYWMRDSNYTWYKLIFGNTGVSNSILTLVPRPIHFNDGSSWFSTGEKIVKRDSNGIWTTYNYPLREQTTIASRGGFYDKTHKCYWLIYPSLMLKLDSTGITKFNWKNSDVSYSNHSSLCTLTNDGKFWMSGGDGSFIRISFDSIMPKPSYEKYTISGNVYHDLNANGSIDSVDNALPFIRVRNDKGVHTYSNFEGYYQFLERPGQRVIQPAPYPYLVLSCDSTSYTVNITSTAIDSLDFALKSIADTLLSVSSFATSRARCDFKSSATCIVKNNGNSSINILAAFTPDAACSVLSFSQAPDSTSGTTFFWKIDSLTLLSSKNIGVTYTVPPASFNSISSIFDTYIYDSTTSALFTTDTILQNIVCSFDPNEKQVSPVGRETAHYTLFSDTLVYTLLFQNTGNDTAYTVTLIDTISPLLDIESFTLLSMSHNGIVTIDSNGVLKVVFDDINLLWESANFDESQGYLQFSILPLPGLPEFTVVKNKVLIIFDRNPYILTNEVFNTLVTTFPTTALNQLQESKHKISVYPNPANTYFNLSFDQPLNTAYVVTLIDISGKIIQSWTTTEQNPTFSIDALKAGFYLIQISNNVDFKAVAKFVKQ